MNNSPLTFPTDRLVDYFCTAGPGDELLPGDTPSPPTPSGKPHPLKADFQPQLIDRFPLSDYKDTPFPTGVANLCFPAGLWLQQSVPPTEPLPSFFTFCATGSSREHVYGHVLVFWERINERQLRCIDAAAVGYQVPPPTAAATAAGGGTGADAAADAAAAAAADAPPVEGAGATPALGGAGTGGDATGAAGAASTSADALSGGDGAGTVTPGHKPGAAGVLFVPRCLCLMSRWNFPEFRTFLTQLYSVAAAPAQLPVERLICNFSSEIPLPPAGRVEVQWTWGAKPISFMRPARNRRVSAMGLPFRDVFEALDLETLLTLWECVLLEQKVLLVSSQLTLLTAAAEVLVSLIYPFRWAHSYIPILPKGLMMTLEAPLPFIAGLPLKVFDEVKDSLPSDVVIVLLDKNSIVTDPELRLPSLPSHQRTKLMRSLERVAGVFAARDIYWPTNRLSKMDNAFDFAPRPDDQDGGEADHMAEDADAYANSDDDERMSTAAAAAAAAKGGGAAWYGLSRKKGTSSSGGTGTGIHVNWHATRRAFFRFFVSLFSRYREFVILPDESADRFNQTAFLETAKPDARPFLDAFLKTQAFAEFVDDRLQPQDTTNVDVEFFDQSIDEKRNRSIYSMFNKKETPFLTSREYLVTKTVITLTPETAGLAGYPDHVYVYPPFPSTLDLKLYYTPREIPSFADASNDSRDRARLRRGGLWDMVGGTLAASAAARAGTATVAGSHAQHSITSNTTDQNVYLTWFLAFVAALDVVGDEVARRAGEEFDAGEALAQAAAGRQATLDALARADAAASAGSSGAAGSPGGAGAFTTPVKGSRSSSLGTATAASSSGPLAASSRSSVLPEIAAGGAREGSVAAQIAAQQAAAKPPTVAAVEAASDGKKGAGRSGSVAAQLLRQASSDSTASALSAAVAATASPSTASSDAPDPAIGRGSLLENSSVFTLPQSYGGGSARSSRVASDGAAPAAASGSAADAPAAPITSASPPSASSVSSSHSLLHKGSAGSVTVVSRTGGVAGDKATRPQRRAAAVSAAKGLYLSSQLEAAFGVLDRMKREGVQPDEIIFRALLEACGRLGSYGKAHAVLQQMATAGIAVDAALYRLLFQAFFHSTSEAHGHGHGRGAPINVPLAGLGFGKGGKYVGTAGGGAGAAGGAAMGGAGTGAFGGSGLYGVATGGLYGSSPAKPPAAAITGFGSSSLPPAAKASAAAGAPVTASTAIAAVPKPATAAPPATPTAAGAAPASAGSAGFWRSALTLNALRSPSEKLLPTGTAASAPPPPQRKDSTAAPADAPTTADKDADAEATGIAETPRVGPADAGATATPRKPPSTAVTAAAGPGTPLSPMVPPRTSILSFTFGGVRTQVAVAAPATPPASGAPPPTPSAAALATARPPVGAGPAAPADPPRRLSLTSPPATAHPVDKTAVEDAVGLAPTPTVATSAGDSVASTAGTANNPSTATADSAPSTATAAAAAPAAAVAAAPSEPLSATPAGQAPITPSPRSDATLDTFLTEGLTHSKRSSPAAGALPAPAAPGSSTAAASVLAAASSSASSSASKPSPSASAPAGGGKRESPSAASAPSSAAGSSKGAAVPTLAPVRASPGISQAAFAAMRASPTASSTPAASAVGGTATPPAQPPLPAITLLASHLDRKRPLVVGVPVHGSERRGSTLTAAPPDATPTLRATSSFVLPPVLSASLLGSSVSPQPSPDNSSTTSTAADATAAAVGGSAAPGAASSAGGGGGAPVSTSASTATSPADGTNKESTTSQGAFSFFVGSGTGGGLAALQSFGSSANVTAIARSISRADYGAAGTSTAPSTTTPSAAVATGGGGGGGGVASRTSSIAAEDAKVSPRTQAPVLAFRVVESDIFVPMVTDGAAAGGSGSGGSSSGSLAPAPAAASTAAAGSPGGGAATSGSSSRQLLGNAIAGTLALGRRFPGLIINMCAQKCPECGQHMIEDDVRRGWSRSENDYTTHHVGCKGPAPPKPLAAAAVAATPAAAAAGGSDAAVGIAFRGADAGTSAAGGAAAASKPPVHPPAAGGGGGGAPPPRRFRGLIEDDGSHVTMSSSTSVLAMAGAATPAPRPAERRFVARFTVASSIAGWKGTMEAGPGALLYCEYLSPAVLVKELHRNIVHGHFSALLRVKAPTMFWNLVAWFTSYNLPIDFLAFLAREEADAAENAALLAGVERIIAALEAAGTVQGIVTNLQPAAAL